MPAVVVDTDVLSFEFKGDTRAALYHPHLAGNVLAVSFMSVAELDLWALEHKWGRGRKKKMQEYLRSYVIHPFDRELCLKWAEVTNGVHRKGQPVGKWIQGTLQRQAARRAAEWQDLLHAQGGEDPD